MIDSHYTIQKRQAPYISVIFCASNTWAESSLNVFKVSLISGNLILNEVQQSDLYGKAKIHKFTNMLIILKGDSYAVKELIYLYF